MNNQYIGHRKNFIFSRLFASMFINNVRSWLLNIDFEHCRHLLNNRKNVQWVGFIRSLFCCILIVLFERTKVPFYC